MMNTRKEWLKEKHINQQESMHVYFQNSNDEIARKESQDDLVKKENFADRVKQINN